MKPGTTVIILALLNGGSIGALAYLTLSSETGKAMIEALGDKAFQEYKKIAGFWLEGISQGAISSMILAEQGGVRMMRTIDGADGPRGAGDGNVRRIVRPPTAP